MNSQWSKEAELNGFLDMTFSVKVSSHSQKRRRKHNKIGDIVSKIYLLLNKHNGIYNVDHIDENISYLFP